jgi:hypothetical protein
MAGVFVLWAAFAGAGPSAAEDAPGQAVVLTLDDGSRLVGTVVSEDGEEVTFRTTFGVELRVARDEIVSRAPAPSAGVAVERSPARADFSDPNDTRLMFAPTGRPLRKGGGYFSDHYVVFPGFAYGLTDHLAISGGVSVVPGLGFDEQVFYISPTVGWRPKPNRAFSLGALYAGASDETEAGAILFGVASFGSSARSLSLGIGLAATRNEEWYFDERGGYSRSERKWDFRDGPILMIGGNVQVGKRLSLVTESWLLTGHDFRLSEQPFGVALRFFGERISVDFGFVVVAEVLDEGFPIPWLSFSYHFGPSRAASKQQQSKGVLRGLAGPFARRR